jgi:tetrapyrrole methylase family protein/MazG family protein
MVKPPENLASFDAFVKIVQALLGPDGCPWDKEQTHRSLAPYAIEESFELAEAIETGDDSDVVGELGDVLLQVVLHAEIARLEKRYSVDDVLKGISEKMIRRHPHVFADVTVGSSKDVLTNWAKIKALEKESEKASKGVAPSHKFDLPVALPALQRAHKIGDKTAKVGFDWPDARGVFEKVEEEIQELRAEFVQVGQDGSASIELRKKLEHEMGDVLFSVAQLARHLGLDAEQSLRVANLRFEARYFNMRAQVETSGESWDSMTDGQKEAAWQHSKR